MKELNWSDNIIRDGFTQPGYVKEVEGLHGSLKFSFRPMLPEEVETLEAMRDRDGPRDPARVRGLLGVEISKRITSWSEKCDGQPAPITEQNVRRLRFALQSKVYNIIAGIVPSDADPEASGKLDDLEPLEVETVNDKLGKL